MQELEKICIVCFDEMSLKSALSYDKHNDCCLGFEDNGINRSKMIAKHGLVFMLRGVNFKWKQAVGFALTGNKIHLDDLYDLLKLVLENSKQIGLEVVAVVADQGPINRAFFEKKLCLSSQTII